MRNSLVFMEEKNSSNDNAYSARTAATSPVTAAASASHEAQQKRILSRTRTGCSICKRRKIKCDEHRPSCRNCIKHNVRCGFLQAGGRGERRGGTESTATTPVPVAGAAAATSPSRPLGGLLTEHPEPALNLGDLELLHNFCMFTYTTFTEDAALRNFWKYTVVRLGVNCDYVMRSILAVSALHMAHHQPEKRESLLGKAIVYHQAASRTAMGLMNDMRAEDWENLWIFSILTMYFALGSPRTQDSSLLIGESGFPDWLFLNRGVQQLFRQLKSSEYDGHLSPLLAKARDLYEASHAQRHADSPFLRDLQSQINGTVGDAELLSIYNFAIDELRAQLSFCLSEDERRLDIIDSFIWQFALADTFMPLLADHQPTQEAAAIFGHFCVILARFEGNWWLQGWGRVLMTRVWEILDSVHRPWIQWATEEMGWIPP